MSEYDESEDREPSPGGTVTDDSSDRFQGLVMGA